uniref:Glycosyl transferase putative n=1 Tax=Albugo laibachii Nc14 TaxID=890382 RepID=F0W520_9STRA|nr:glycosyl transferase putative [Albugo laibachii Nc14]|eukprot:CCA16211.1 glycosyl transferase putative [Albugo laibachii Nc14]
MRVTRSLGRLLSFNLILLAFIRANSPLRHLLHKSKSSPLRAKAKSNFAYVTVHYEGTSRDQEYVLGIQVLMQSIKLSGTRHDLVVLVSESVTLATKKLFRDIGCRVLEVVDITNPFLNHTLKNQNFIHTLNKLHVWNLLEYDRVVYLDADNIVLRNADELFMCGPFCAVFMNPCHFHTGLLVVTPDKEEYQRLLHQLEYQSSFDGADQGFLSSVYSNELRKAPLFTPFRVNPNKKTSGMRLSVGYNINHKYYYEQYHWKLFYLRHFATMTSPLSPIKVVVESARPIPAITIGFPITPQLKPWYWWAAFLLDLHHVWHDVRGTLPSKHEQYGFHCVSHALFQYVLTVLLTFTFVFVIRHFIPLRLVHEKMGIYILRKDPHSRTFYLFFRIALVSLAAWFSPNGIHPLSRLHDAFLSLIGRNVGILVLLSSVLYSFRKPVSVEVPPILFLTRFWMQVANLILIESFVLWASTWQIFPNILFRLVVLASMLFLCGCWQTHFLKFGIETECIDKTDRRSL